MYLPIFLAGPKTCSSALKRSYCTEISSDLIVLSVNIVPRRFLLLLAPDLSVSGRRDISQTVETTRERENYLNLDQHLNPLTIILSLS